jgi:hypothetical protein
MDTTVQQIDTTRPITCYCKAKLGRFNPVTGCIVHPLVPTGLLIFGLFFVCFECGRRFKFDGLRAGAEEREGAGAPMRQAVPPMSYKDDPVIYVLQLLRETTVSCFCAILCSRDGNPRCEIVTL